MPPSPFLVICTRFELVTSCLSSKLSKPTELTDHFSLSKSGCKSTNFFRIGKIFFSKNLQLTDTKRHFFLRRTSDGAPFLPSAPSETAKIALPAHTFFMPPRPLRPAPPPPCNPGGGGRSTLRVVNNLGPEKTTHPAPRAKKILG